MEQSWNLLICHSLNHQGYFLTESDKIFPMLKTFNFYVIPTLVATMPGAIPRGWQVPERR